MARRFLHVPQAPTRQPSMNTKTLLEGFTDHTDVTHYFHEEQAAIPSQLLPRLTELERDFFQYVRNGDLEKVDQLLKTNVNFNINCQNYRGHTALVIAICNGHKEIVSYLLQYKHLSLGNSLLHAVQSGDPAVVNLILDKLRLEGYRDNVYVWGPNESADFSPDMTPLILACHNHNYEIIRLLLGRGHSLETPHPPSCFCKERCERRKQGESLTMSTARFNTYKAMSSPAYMCQSSQDPVLAAFKLSQEMANCAEVETEFKKAYLELATACKKFAVDIMAQTRTTEEVCLLMNEPGGAEHLSKAILKYPRIMLAIELEQKEFIAHPHCQQVLRSRWLEGWQDWRRLNFASKCMRLLPRLFFLPVMAMIYWLVPKSQFVSSWRAPLNKFFSFASSYGLFLVIIIVQSYMPNYSLYRGPTMSGMEWYIVVFIVGLLWNNIKTLFIRGYRQYLKDAWNVFDLVMILLFLGSFVCSWVSLFNIHVHPEIYDVPRHMWKQYNPTLIAESLYSYAVVLAFGKLFFFFQIGRSLGPLQVSMSRMLEDIAHFLLLFLVVTMSFALGLHSLYHYYVGQTRTINGQTISQNNAFSTFWMSIHTLYWSIYGYSPPYFADVITAEFYVQEGDEMVAHVNNHWLTQNMGQLMFALFYICGIIILINMLIAMMSTSFSSVQNNSDTEWKFARTKIWMSFFERGRTLPPPFNLIPSPKSFYTLLLWVGSLLCLQNTNAYCSWQRCCYVDKEAVDEEQAEMYAATMASLIQRYLINHGRLKEDPQAFDPAKMAQMAQLHQLTNDMRELRHMTTRSIMTFQGQGHGTPSPRSTVMSDAVFMDSPHKHSS